MTTEFDQGKAAYSDDKNLEDNPHKGDLTKSADWEAGWRQAEENDPLSPANLGEEADDDED